MPAELFSFAGGMQGLLVFTEIRQSVRGIEVNFGREQFIKGSSVAGYEILRMLHCILEEPQTGLKVVLVVINLSHSAVKLEKTFIDNVKWHCLAR